MSTLINIRSSCCNNPLNDCNTRQTLSQTQKTLKAIPSTVLSVLIAFFPKCPFCWAAYMSMFGSFGLSRLPYLSWLFPVLAGFLGLHLLLIFKKSGQKGYGPFMLSLTGALLLVGGRSLLPAAQWILFTGMLLILAGSLWNSFSAISFKTSVSHSPIK